jgi:hypothetical protein
LSDVCESPCRVENWRFHPVHFGPGSVHLDRVVVAAESVFELVVEASHPVVVVDAVAILVAGELVDLVLKLFEAWQKRGRKGKKEIRRENHKS